MCQCRLGSHISTASHGFLHTSCYDHTFTFMCWLCWRNGGSLHAIGQFSAWSSHHLNALFGHCSRVFSCLQHSNVVLITDQSQLCVKWPSVWSQHTVIRLAVLHTVRLVLGDEGEQVGDAIKRPRFDSFHEKNSESNPRTGQYGNKCDHCIFFLIDQY